MGRTYRYKFKGDPKSVVARMKCEAASFPVSFAGDEKSGAVEGWGLKAGYGISEQILTVIIHRIPLLVSWGMVEKELEKRAPEWGMTRID
ncbi:MAG: hypothetical protein HXY24_10410 [Rubrivivax sp.]|nr:hypothetical protein [Rubrivivax sp.]